LQRRKFVKRLKMVRRLEDDGMVASLAGALAQMGLGAPVVSARSSRPLLVGDPAGRVRMARSAAATLDELRAELEALCGVPADEQLLSCPGCELPPAGPLSLPAFAMVHVRVRCLGGKGGFGAMLRGQASRPGMKKVETNTGAMRDLSGRRLRHVEQEAQLKDWVKEEGKRKADKEAEKKEKRAKQTQELHATAAEYVAAAAVDQDEVADAVRQGIEEERRRKQKEEEERKAKAVAATQSAKKLSKLFGDDSDEDDGSSADESGGKQGGPGKK